MNLILRHRWRFATRTVPNVQYFDSFVCRRDFVENAIIQTNNFSPRSTRTTRASGTDHGKSSQDFYVIQYLSPNGCRCGWIVSGNITANFPKISDSRIRPNYFVFHEANSFSTSSCVLKRPPAISASPWRMAAKISTSSAISPIEMSSGSLLMVSSASCLSVIKHW